MPLLLGKKKPVATAPVNTKSKKVADEDDDEDEEEVAPVKKAKKPVVEDVDEDVEETTGADSGKLHVSKAGKGAAWLATVTFLGKEKEKTIRVKIKATNIKSASGRAVREAAVFAGSLGFRLQSISMRITGE